MRMKIVKVTTGGQVSIPAEIRRRWGTRRLIAEDEGDRLVLRPAPDDPISAAIGSLKGLGRGILAEELRRMGRDEEAAIEERKWRRFSTPTRS